MSDLHVRCSFYCDARTLTQLRRLAADRHIPFSECVRVCLAEYLQLRADFAAAVTEPGELGDSHAGLLHRVLSTSEARMAASFTAQGQQLARMQRELQALRAMLDRSVLMYLLHTAEVPSELRQAAEASGKRRHDQWQKAVQRLLQNGSLASLTVEEDDDDPHPQRRTTPASG